MPEPITPVNDPTDFRAEALTAINAAADAYHSEYDIPAAQYQLQRALVCAVLALADTVENLKGSFYPDQI